jgi:multicomponent Na+:H+ antiporter subunit F
VHIVVFAAAAVWMTVFLAMLVIFAIRTESTTVRILAVDALALVLVALLVFSSTVNQQPYYLDAALAISLFSFIGTVVAARRHANERVL